MQRMPHGSYMLSPVRLSSVHLSSVAFVHCTQSVEIFGSVSASFDFVPWPSVDIHGKFCRDRPGELLRSGNPSVGGVKRKTDRALERFWTCTLF